MHTKKHVQVCARCRKKTFINLLKCIIQAILITGGDETEMSVEVLNADGTRGCLLPNLPEGRRYHSLSGTSLCGGLARSGRPIANCLRLNSRYNQFQPLENTIKARYGHTSWRSQKKIMLMGGYVYEKSFSPTTSTEKYELSDGDNQFRTSYDVIENSV